MASIFVYLPPGEEVEFEIYEEPGGRSKAVSVTGPNGSYVKGSPSPEDDFRGGNNRNEGY